MRALVIAAALPVLLWAGIAAADQGDSHWTCGWMGNGSTVTIDNTFPANPSFGGVAIVGVGGLKVVTISIPGRATTYSTNGLPGSATGEVFVQQPLNGAGVLTNTVVVGLDGPVPGTGGVFGEYPTNSPPSDYFSLVTCPRIVTPTVIFNPTPKFAYDPATGQWYQLVPVSGPGIVTFGEVFSTHSTRAVGAIQRFAATLLVKNGKVVAKKAGRVKMTLVPTAAGKAQLKAKGVLKLYLKVTFTPTGGTAASKVLTLSLRAK